MTDENHVLLGHYRFEDGKFVADDAMQEINNRVRYMRLLFDSGSCVPSFLLDPEDGSYWRHTYFEDYSEELRRVDRAYIESDFPTVDPDRPIT
jgi:hypothetical protein